MSLPNIEIFKVNNSVVVALMVAIAFHTYRCDCSGGAWLAGDATESQIAEEIAEDNPPVALTWARTIGSLFDEEWATSVLVIQDGYMVLGKKTWIQGGDDAAWVVRLDEQGNIIWSRLFDNVDHDNLYSMQPVSGEGYIFCGRSNSLDITMRSSWVVRVDDEGSLLWQKIFHEQESFELNEAYSIAQAAADGFLVAGYHGHHDDGDWGLTFIMLDEDGNLLWSKIYPEGIDWGGASLLRTQDDGFILAGMAGGDYSRESIMVMKLDSEANALWTKSYDGPRDLVEHSMQQTADGGYIIIGKNIPDQLTWDFEPFVLRLDPNGSVLWYKVLRADSLSLRISSIAQSPDGGYVLVGSFYPLLSPHEEQLAATDLLIVKMDEEGAVRWQRAYGGDNLDSAADVQAIPGGGYIVVGNSLSFGDGRSEAWILKLDENGELSEDCQAGTSMSSDIAAIPADFTATDVPTAAAAAGSLSEFSDTGIEDGEFNETVGVQCEN